MCDVLEHITRDGERWDSLAWQYYVTRWAIPGLLQPIRTWPLRRAALRGVVTDPGY